LYKRPGSSLPLSVFLEFLCHGKFFHSQIGFLDVHGSYYTTIVYIHYIFYFIFWFNLIHENFISASSCALYIYVCVCISFWLISFYLWLVLIFLFNKVYYGFTPLQHWMSWHIMTLKYNITLLVLTYRNLKHCHEHMYKQINQCWGSFHILELGIGMCKVRVYVYHWPTVLKNPKNRFWPLTNGSKKPKEPVLTLDRWFSKKTQRTGSDPWQTVLKKPKEPVLTLDWRFLRNPKNWFRPLTDGSQEIKFRP